MKFFDWLQRIDRRIMYLLLAVVIACPLIWDMNMPMAISPAVVGVYDAVEKMPSDKMAIIIIYWGSGTVAENRPQVEALMRHFMMRGKRFAVLAFDPQGSKFSYDSGKAISAQLGKKYGEDWVHWGFRPPANLIPLLQALPRDIHKRIGTDINGTPLGDIPAMNDIRKIEDIGLLADTTSVGELDNWIAYIHGPYRTPIVYGPTAVMTADAFNSLDAGQIVGLLPGMQGAAAYESMLNHRGFATRATGALSSSHLLIIILIIIGNIGYLTSRKRQEQHG